jgi:hypothetical protein
MDKSILEQFTLQLILAAGEQEKAKEKSKEKAEVEKAEAAPEKEGIIRPVTAEKAEEEVVKKIEEAPVLAPEERPFPPLPVVRPRPFIPAPPKPLELPVPPPLAPLEIPKPAALAAAAAPAIDLGKLNQFVADASVSSIQCEAGKKVLVKKDAQTTETDIVLSAAEIDETIKKFAAAAKAEITAPIFKATAGNLAISAIISPLIGSRFLISKR